MTTRGRRRPTPGPCPTKFSSSAAAVESVSSTVVELTAAGSRCAIGYLENETAAKETQEIAVATGGPEPVLVRGDLGTDPAGLVTTAIEELGGLGGLVTTAVPIIAGRTMKVTREEYDRVFDVQVWGLWEAVRTAVPELGESRRLGGRGQQLGRQPLCPLLRGNRAREGGDGKPRSLFRRRTRAARRAGQRHLSLAGGQPRPRRARTSSRVSRTCRPRWPRRPRCAGWVIPTSWRRSSLRCCPATSSSSRG